MDQKRLKQLLDMLTYDEFKLLFLEFVQEEPEVGEKLNKFILKKLRKEETENPEQLVDRSFSKMEERVEYDMRDWDNVEHQSRHLFEMARKAISSEEPDTALIIATRWLEDFAEYYNEAEISFYEDDGVDLNKVCHEAEDIIKEAIAQPNVSQKVRTATAAKLKKLVLLEDNPFIDYDYLDIEDLSDYINSGYLSDDDTLKVIEQLLEEDFNNTKLIRQKYDLLKKLGRDVEAEEFIEDNTDNYEVADTYIDELFGAGRYQKLIPILEDLTDPQYETPARPTVHWLEILAKSQDKMGLTEEAINTYRRLFIASEGDLEVYNILKERVEDKEWPQFMDEMVKETKFKTFYTNGKNHYAKLLLIDGRFQALHDWLKTQNVATINYYRPLLPKELRTDI